MPGSNSAPGGITNYRMGGIGATLADAAVASLTRPDPDPCCGHLGGQSRGPGCSSTSESKDGHPAPGLIVGPLVALALLGAGAGNDIAWQVMLALGAVPAAAVRTMALVKFTSSTFGLQETDVNSPGKTIGFDDVYIKSTVRSSSKGERGARHQGRLPLRRGHHHQRRQGVHRQGHRETGRSRLRLRRVLSCALLTRRGGGIRPRGLSR